MLFISHRETENKLVWSTVTIFKNIQTHPILEQQAVQARAAEQQSHTERITSTQTTAPHPTTRLGLPTACSKHRRCSRVAGDRLQEGQMEKVMTTFTWGAVMFLYLGQVHILYLGQMYISLKVLYTTFSVCQSKLMIQMAQQSFMQPTGERKILAWAPDFGRLTWKETMEEVLKGSVLKDKFDGLWSIGNCPEGFSASD